MSSDSQTRGELMGSLVLLLRDATGQLQGVSQGVGSKVGLSAVDIRCLDLISRVGPVTPGALAEMCRLSPATMTGILDRLEEDGWVRRERDPEDRRRIFVHGLHERVPELAQHFGGMLRSLSEIFAGYSVEELRLLLDFLTKVRDAGQGATAALHTSDG
ncbi:MAG: MarR family winged helix-turn-helix transcriptional regulator [Actinomycetota bacterium]